MEAAGIKRRHHSNPTPHYGIPVTPNLAEHSMLTVDIAGWFLAGFAVGLTLFVLLVRQMLPSGGETIMWKHEFLALLLVFAATMALVVLPTFVSPTPTEVSASRRSP